MSKIHVSHSELTNSIYAGSVAKDKSVFLSDKTDVTGQTVFAVARHVEQFGEPVTVSDGKKTYKVTVKPVLAKGAEK